MEITNQPSNNVADRDIPAGGSYSYRLVTNAVSETIILTCVGGLRTHEFISSRYNDCNIRRTMRSRVVIPPFLAGSSRRTHAAIFSFIAGVMPPMPMLGRSLL
jgi:hypothetical protein